MFLQIFILILLILIVLLLFLFLKPLHIYLTFNNNNLNYNGIISVKHILFFSYDIQKEMLNVGIKIKTNEFMPLHICFSNDETQKSKFFSYVKRIINYLSNIFKSDDIEDDNKSNDSESTIVDKVSEIYPLLNKSASDLYEIVLLVATLCRFNESHAIINFGLNNNNLTIKICNIIWAVTAPLYPLNIKILLTPEINQLTLKSDIDVSCNVFLINILKIFFKVITNRNILNIVKIISKW